MTDPIYIVSPVGRMLQGDPFLLREKKFNDIPVLDKNGAPKMEVYIGVAVPKGPEFDAFWMAVQQKGQQDFPNGLSQVAGFAWKIEDGDAPKFQGKEGYAGHFLLKMSTKFVPECYDPDYNRLLDKSQLARGDFVQVQVGVQGNEAPAGGNPGMYLNPNSVMRVAYGQRISSAPDPRTVYAAPTALPPGASLTPLAPVNMPAPMGQPAPGQSYAGQVGGLAPQASPPAAPTAAPGAYAQPPTVAPGYAAPGAPPAQYAAPGVPPQYAAPGVPPQYAAPGAPPAQYAAPDPAYAYAGAPGTTQYAPPAPVAAQYAAPGVPPGAPAPPMPGAPPVAGAPPAVAPGVAPAPAFINPEHASGGQLM